MSSPEIVKTMKLTVVGATFTQVCVALGNGMANVFSGIQEEFDAFLKEKGIENCYLAIAQHSMGGRKWESVDGKDVLFFAEEGGYGHNPGWHFLTSTNAQFVELVSASSGSKLTAERDQYGGDTWTVSLEVPIGADGQPYQGLYWHNFHNVFEVVSLYPPKEEPVVEAVTASC